MKPITLYIFDNNKEQLDKMSAALKSLFEYAGVEVEPKKFVITAEDNKFYKTLYEKRPEIIVFDNHFASTPLSSRRFGQNAIAKIKEKLPDSVCVLMTQENLPEKGFGEAVPHHDILVSKYHLETWSNEGREKYRDWLISEFDKNLKRARIDDIDLGDCKEDLDQLRSRPPSGQRRRKITPAEITSLIEQICHTGGEISDNIIEGVRIKSLPGGHSGKSDAVVCTVAVKNKYGQFNVPAVLKFLDRKSALREAHNHSKYVKWTLPYRWRVDIIGIANTAEFGAVCYSFAHGGSGDPETLTKLIEAKEDDRAIEVMKEMFNVNSNTWYGQTRPNEMSLVSYLTEDPIYFRSNSTWERRQDVLVELLQLANDAGELELYEDTTVRVSDQHIAIGQLFKKIREITAIPVTVECLSHGDLNSGNILVREETSEFSFIDFQNTGWHHRARDFCALEGSIRTRSREKSNRKLETDFIDEYLAIESFAEEYFNFKQTEKKRAPDMWTRFRLPWSKDPQKQGANLQDNGSSLINALRGHFYANHPDATPLEYVISSFVHTWWMLSFTIWNKDQSRRLLAFFLASWRWINENTPPDEQLKNSNAR